MAKYSGNIGFSVMEKTAAGVIRETIKERHYVGDVVTNVRRWETGDGPNDNIQVQNQISIVMDEFAYSALHSIRYVTWMGAKWKVTSVQIDRPRLVISIGGVYNEQLKTRATGDAGGDSGARP